jgi:hypothetical protein
MRSARQLVLSVMLSAVAVAVAVAAPFAARLQSALFEGETVRLTMAERQKGQKAFRLGPWNFGAKLVDGKPHDKRHNLYIVAPGTEQTMPGWEEYSHNILVSDVPESANPVEWDVYWAVVLDPALQDEIRSEKKLILYAQETFQTGDDYEFEEVPARLFLKSFMGVKSCEELDRYRRPNGEMPRVLIVPAKFAVRAKVERIEGPVAPPVTAKADPSSH